MQDWPVGRPLYSVGFGERFVPHFLPKAPLQVGTDKQTESFFYACSMLAFVLQFFSLSGAVGSWEGVRIDLGVPCGSGTGFT